MSVADAVRRDLASLERRLDGISESAEAAVALQLAVEMDDAKNSATSKSMCAARLNETMEALRAMCPPEQKHDALDEIAARRDKRRKSA